MNYHILNDEGKTIASFIEKADRDVCFDAMNDYWGEDCNLTTKDD